MENNLEIFEEHIGYKFKNIELLKRALTHTSYAYQYKTQSNERLEFLGDSILELVSSEDLYENYDNLSEGEMTKVRAYAVCEESLYQIALNLKINEFIYLGRSEIAMHTNKKAILADSVEAIIAAIYLDSDLETVRKFIMSNIKDKLEFASKNVGLKDYKTVLQEKLQVHGDVKIKYTIIKEEGPDHDKRFTAQVECNNKVLAIGSGRSKKGAEMEAARKALGCLE